MFRTRPGRNYWKYLGTTRKSLKTAGRRERAFLQILDEEYEKVSESALSWKEGSMRERSKREVISDIADAIDAAAVIVLCASIVRWSFRRCDRS
jgi:hypothetical protein